MYSMETGAPLNEARLLQVKAFLSASGLTVEDLPDYTVALRDGGGQIVATGSLCGDIVKYVAVADAAQGEGACATVVSELVSYACRNGNTHLFLFTKPENDRMFSSLGFYELARTKDALMMENKKDGLSGFLKSLGHGAMENAGAVVVNCNPLTNGHLYLLETAAKNCSELHVFVVSEDKSEFPAEVRYDLVKRGAAHIENLYVHRGGRYVVSSATFPAYFLKDKNRTEDIKADLDLALFGARIAPALRIKTRFVGTEPYCTVTNAYNARMKALLPNYGVDVVELERKDGISASAVRRLMREGNFEAIKPLVPEVTYDYIVRHA
ncbi:MAG: [citrate (pro-3S)-lyase] ligase [Clostridiaceae bacterium]|nr:[citrate (pro-3S)-lyase] ligase [Eubacteriales bacterium]